MDMPTTDATFQYRTFEWTTSRGDVFEYEYVVAQQPAGGATARNALLAVEETVPRPPSGWTIILIPSVSVVCSGKEEMRPLATLLSQQGHRCYILAWPGWTVDVQINFAMVRCRVEELAAEYEDFWCQVLEHVAEAEASEVARGPRSEGPAAAAAAAAAGGRPPRLCLAAAGLSGLYAQRALRSMRRWEAGGGGGGGAGAGAARHLELYESLVLLAPSWRAPRRRGPLAKLLRPAAACRWMGYLLHSDSRALRPLQEWYFSKMAAQRHFVHAGTKDAERLWGTAAWLFQRQRPYAQTDAAVLHGLLDPSGGAEDGSAVEALADEVSAAAAGFSRGVLLLLPQPGRAPSGGAEDGEALAAALEARRGSAPVERVRLPVQSALPHEVDTSAVLVALHNWLSMAGSTRASA